MPTSSFLSSQPRLALEMSRSWDLTENANNHLYFVIKQGMHITTYIFVIKHGMQITTYIFVIKQGMHITTYIFVIKQGMHIASSIFV